MKKIRILYVITALNIGGAEMMLYHMLGYLAPDVYDVAVISLLDRGDVAHRIEDDYNLLVIALNLNKGLNRLRFIELLGKEIKRWQPDLVHSHMYHANIATRLARIFYHIPVLINTIHNISESDSRVKAKLRLLSYRITNKLADLVTQVSRVGLEKYLSLKAVSVDNSCYVPNGISMKTEQPGKAQVEMVKSELGIDNAFIFLAVGSLTRQKDYPNMLKAFARFARDNSNAVLLIAGSGSVEKELKVLTVTLNLGEKVKFLGLRSDIPVLMHMADVFVLSSEWEGMPVVLLEAARSKLPIIATDVGGNSEIVIDQETGYLVPPQDESALSSAMMKMVALDEKERAGMGEQGYDYVKLNYSLEKVMTKWDSIYKDAATMSESICPPR